MPEGDLPPIPGQQRFAPTATPLPVPGQASGQAPGAPLRAPGRPSLDPESEVRRQERHETRKRLMDILPMRAVDDKVKIYRVRKGRVPPGAKPVLEVLCSELEKGKEEGIKPDQVIEDALLQHFGDECTDQFQCRVFDKTGQPVTSIAPWDVNLGDIDDLDDGDGDFDDEDAALGFDAANFSRGAPPAAAHVDGRPIVEATREAREEEARRSNETVSMITTLSQTASQAQQQAASQMTTVLITMMQSQQQAAEQARREAVERDERARREAAEREERDRQRRDEKTKMLLAALPIFLPIVQKLLGLDRQGLDPGTQALVEVLKDQAKNKSDPAEAITAMLPKMMEFQTSMAQTSMAGIMNMQNTVNKMNMDSVIDTMKRLKDETSGGGGEKSTMETIGEIVSAVGPMLQGQQPVEAPTLPAPVQQQPQQPRRRLMPPPPPPAAPQAPAPPPSQAATAAPARAVPRQSPHAAIRSCLHAIRKMSTGEHPAEQRWDVLHWVATRLPQPLLQKLAAGDQDSVVQAGGGVVMADPVLLAWIQEPDSGGFLTEALNDLRVMIVGKLTPDIAKVAVDQQAAYIRSHAKPPAASTATPPPAAETPAAAPAAEVAPAAVEPPLAAPASTPSDASAPAAG